MNTTQETQRFPGSEIVPILMERDGIPRNEAEQLLSDARKEARGVRDYDVLEELMMDWFGLEPDYMMELL